MTASVPSSYVGAPGRIPRYFAKIQRGTAPPRFTVEFLENMGFRAKTDRDIIRILKVLRFLDDSGQPTQNYRDFLDPQRGKAVLGRQILSAYEGLFQLERQANLLSPTELEGKFKSLANATPAVARFMAQTFLNLCKSADLEQIAPTSTPALERPPAPAVTPESAVRKEMPPLGSTTSDGGLHYHIEIHLPNTTDPEVFRAIFKALREHLL